MRSFHAASGHAMLLGSLVLFSAPDAAIRLVDIAAQAGLTLLNVCGGPSKDYIVEVNGNGAAFFDYDNDGAQDVYVTAFGPNVLFRGNGDGTFTDVTARANVGDPHWSTNCAFADYDRDGDLDCISGSAEDERSAGESAVAG